MPDTVLTPPPGDPTPVQPPPNAGAAPDSSTKLPVLEPTEFYGLLKLVIVDSSLTPDQKRTLIDELRKSTPASDRWTFRWAIWILGLVVILTIVALWSLSTGKYSIPEGLVAIGSAAAGGLAGLLTPGRGREQ